MTSPQTLDLNQRRLLALWAADCAQHVSVFIENEDGAHDRARAAIALARSFASGELPAGEAIRRRFGGGSSRPLLGSAATAALRAAGQASAVCHMGAHALGAAAFAALASASAEGAEAEAGTSELRWQLDQASGEVRATLRALPRLGENRAGPLGAGLLARGEVGRNICLLQDALITGVIAAPC